MRPLAALVCQVLAMQLVATSGVYSQSAAADAAPAQAQIRVGRELFKSKAQCQFCHGWAGDGAGEAHSPGGAANLRKTALSRAQLLLVIACGLPGTSMPHFDAYAYSEGRCYGLRDTGARIAANPPRPLQAREIAAIVDYLLADVVGRGNPTREECMEFYADAAECAEYPSGDRKSAGDR
jgi:mono/diheme cytochrome c family protein